MVSAVRPGMFEEPESLIAAAQARHIRSRPLIAMIGRPIKLY